MKIYLTGACGYVGSALLPRLLAEGHDVTAIDTQWFWSDSRVKRQDIRTVTDIGQQDVIIHLAAIANDPSVNFYPKRSWETAVLATQQLCQLAAKQSCRFIYASSVSVYGADRGMVTEDMDVHPLSDYNKTKMCAERVLLSYPEVKPQIIRPATVCGLAPRMRLDLTVNLLTMQAMTKGVMTVHGGAQMRPSIHIDDLVNLYVFMLYNPKLTGIWNAGFENYSILHIAKKVQAVTGARIDITEEKDRRSYQVNSNKLLATGFEPTKSINDAIGELHAACRAGEITNKPQWHNLNWMQTQEIADV